MEDNDDIKVEVIIPDDTKDSAYPSDMATSVDVDVNTLDLSNSLDINLIGDIGEHFFCEMFACGGMNVHFLGEKAKYLDCFVSFKWDGRMYEFLVQIKSTNDEIKEGETTASGLDKQKYDLLQKHHCPTYLARIDISNKAKKKMYIKGVFQTSDKAKCSVIQCSKKNKLSFDTNEFANSKKIMNDIAKEVVNYWNNSKVLDYKASFQTQFKD